MTPDQIRLALADGCDSLDLETNDEQLARLVSLLVELERWGRRVNLTAIREIPLMISGHVLDSLAVQPFLRGDSVIDIGTGAGFPGLPLAILNPEREFVLLDSNGKKIAFVQHILTLLGLDNVQAVKSRAEDYAPGRSFDTVIARALASVARILAVGGHLAGENGVVLALKGRYPAEELEETKTLPGHWGYTVDEIRVPGLSQHARHIVSLERRAE